MSKMLKLSNSCQKYRNMSNVCQKCQKYIKCMLKIRNLYYKCKIISRFSDFAHQDLYSWQNLRYHVIFFKRMLGNPLK